MDLQALTQQYQGTTLARLIEHQIRSIDEGQLLAAIQGTYPKFPEAFRSLVDSYTLEYPQQEWFGEQMISSDLSDIFSKAIHDARSFASENGVRLTDDQLFDMFNLAVMRISYFAHSNRDFRKDIGIKKGWFS